MASGPTFARKIKPPFHSHLQCAAVVLSTVVLCSAALEALASLPSKRPCFPSFKDGSRSVLKQGSHGLIFVAFGVVPALAFDGRGLPFKAPRAEHQPFHCSAAPAHANHARCASQLYHNSHRIMSSLDNESGAMSLTAGACLARDRVLGVLLRLLPSALRVALPVFEMTSDPVSLHYMGAQCFANTGSNLLRPHTSV